MTEGVTEAGINIFPFPEALIPGTKGKKRGEEVITKQKGDGTEGRETGERF